MQHSEPSRMSSRFIMLPRFGLSKLDVSRLSQIHFLYLFSPYERNVRLWYSFNDGNRNSNLPLGSFRIEVTYGILKKHAIHERSRI
ncbi:hypothetical protein PFISCL1PPCAC_21941 [Pristionchus fissidentatus]|uniref:Uncharacterized protein n=1 Tax=Pristionchus fissidentatus TaxID=1538716 RepID=A0AAV5WIV5_9BILA|nr:hypothetical protein PFISCL1PPCAC_21941 [Pristionchus fissidentatus]